MGSSLNGTEILERTGVRGAINGAGAGCIGALQIGGGALAIARELTHGVSTKAFPKSASGPDVNGAFDIASIYTPAGERLLATPGDYHLVLENAAVKELRK